MTMRDIEAELRNMEQQQADAEGVLARIPPGHPDRAETERMVADMAADLDRARRLVAATKLAGDRGGRRR